MRNLQRGRDASGASLLCCGLKLPYETADNIRSLEVLLKKNVARLCMLWILLRLSYGAIMCIELAIENGLSLMPSTETQKQGPCRRPDGAASSLRLSSCRFGTILDPNNISLLHRIKDMN